MARMTAKKLAKVARRAAAKRGGAGPAHCRARRFQNRFQDPFQCDTLPAGGDREGGLLDLSDPTQGSQ